jgi:uncharacterized protein YbaR (Trm112 family)
LEYDLDVNLLNILVCPSCKSSLIHDGQKNILVCKAEKLAYPINNFPVMLIEDAMLITLEEVERYG